MKRILFSHTCWIVFLALFVAKPVLGQVTITEIMYNNGLPGVSGRKAEFIELFNPSVEPVDLAGYSFSRGIDFTFVGNQVWLEGHSYLVVCADPATILGSHSVDVNLLVGPWNPETALSNGGETIELVEPSGVVVARVRYNDRGKWPVAADGTGHSLEIRSPYRELDDPDSWAHSSELGGSPGEANPPPPPVTALFNEGLIWTQGVRWVELYNPTDEEISLENHFFTIDRRELRAVPLGSTDRIPPGGWLVLRD